MVMTGKLPLSGIGDTQESGNLDGATALTPDTILNMESIWHIDELSRTETEEIYAQDLAQYLEWLRAE